MQILPATEYAPLVRTYFADKAAWDALLKAIGTPNSDGFTAFVTIVNQTEFADAELAQLQLPSASTQLFDLVICADKIAMSNEQFPLLCSKYSTGQTVRVIACELWGIENNLSIGNMDFEEFVKSADTTGIFRGFI